MTQPATSLQHQRAATRVRSYVIDTSVLLSDPNALLHFAEHEVIVPVVVATKALAHKLARASYHILKEKQPFDAKRCFA